MQYASAQVYIYVYPHNIFFILLLTGEYNDLQPFAFIFIADITYIAALIFDRNKLLCSALIFLYTSLICIVPGREKYN